MRLFQRPKLLLKNSPNSRFHILNSKFGFTLLELMLYAVIVAIISGLIFLTFLSIINARQRAAARAIVDENLDFAIKKIEQSIKSASEVVVPAVGNSSNTLTLLISNITTTYYLSTDYILKKQIGGASPVDITSGRVIASPFSDTDYLFYNIQNPSNPSTIQTKIKIKYKSEDERLANIESKLQTTISLR